MLSQGYTYVEYNMLTIILRWINSEKAASIRLNQLTYR
jgi:hypothetical protein